MKTASTALKNDQTKIYQRHWKQALLYRTAWNSGTNKYEWEGTPVDITEKYVVKINPVKWKLDTEGLNVWKVSNVTVEVDNKLNIWAPDNPRGIFADKFARGSKVVIKAGNYLADESKEVLYVFTGIIDKDLEFELDKKTCRIPLTSFDFLLQRANAENVSTSATVYRSGDGSTTTFDTNPHTGVGMFTSVKVGGIVKEAGKDWTTSQMNDPDNYGNCIFKVAPPSGTDNIELKYYYWFQDKTIDWLVEELVKEADITDYQIDPALFDNFILGEWEQSTTADFNAGTPVNVDTSGDKVILATQNKSLYGDTITISGGYFFLLDSTVLSSIKDNNENTFAKILMGSVTEEGWVGLEFDAFQGITYLEFVQEWDSGATTLAVDFYYNGSWHFYINITLTDTKETIQLFSPKSNVKRVRLRRPAGQAVIFLLYEFRAFGPSTTGNLLSQTKDLSVDVVAYGKLDYTYFPPTETAIVINTQSSANGTDWEAEKGLGVNQQVLSTVQRYFRWRAYLYNNSTYKTPTLYDVTLNYTLSDIKIDLANFTGLDCYSAIKKLAEFVDYEIGFNAEGKFFFRSKETVTSPVLTLSDQQDKLTKIYNLVAGWNWVYNWIEAQYGSYVKIMDPISRGETRPHSIDKYGFRRLTLSGGQLLIDNEVDIATGIAMRYYGKFDTGGSLVYYRYPTPNIMCNAQIKFLPQLDLSDVVTVEYFGETEGEKVVFKFDAWKFNNFKFAPEPILRSTDFRIIGIDLDLEKFWIKLDLREIDA